MLNGLLAQRAEAASRFYHIDPVKSLNQMLPNANKKMGDPIAYILSRTLMRPRDAIQFLNRCIREATGKERISWENIHCAEKAYSEERLLALRDEWKDPYLDIDRVLELFRGRRVRLSREEMTNIFEEIAYLVADDSFRGVPWLTHLCERMWAGDYAKSSWYEVNGRLASLLFGIGFLGLASGPNTRPKYSYQQPELVLRDSDLPPSIYFVIHPAFQRALDAVDPEQREHTC